MQRALAIGLALFLTLAMASPSLAGVVVITAAAPLADESDEAVQAALDEAVGHAVDGAKQMGLRPVQLANAELWSDRVVVQVVAIDGTADEGDAVPAPGEPDRV